MHASQAEEEEAANIAFIAARRRLKRAMRVERLRTRVSGTARPDPSEPYQAGSDQLSRKTVSLKQGLRFLIERQRLKVLRHSESQNVLGSAALNLADPEQVSVYTAPR